MQPDIHDTDSEVKSVYNTLLARDDDRLTFHFVDRLFVKKTSDLQGAVGTRMVPVFQEEVDRRMDELRDYEWSSLSHVYDDAAGPNETWDEWIEDQIDREGIRLVLDQSYICKYGRTVKDETERLTGNRPEYVECMGGGRMFRGQSFDHVYDDDLMRLVHDTENNDSPQWATPYL